MKSLLLSFPAWDLTLDVAGDIAVAPASYGLAQDVACACRLFLGELWYDTSKGIPYFADTLGEFPPLQLVRAHLEAAALTVPGVTQTRAVISIDAKRKLTGQIRFLDPNGNAQEADL